MFFIESQRSTEIAMLTHPVHVAPCRSRAHPTLFYPCALSPCARVTESGVYFGWASLERGESTTDADEGPWKCVANVGYSPTFAGQENPEKIVEGHLISYRGKGPKHDRVGGGGKTLQLQVHVFAMCFYGITRKSTHRNVHHPLRVENCTGLVMPVTIDISLFTVANADLYHTRVG